MGVKTWQLVLAIVSGVVLGVFYFGGLWLTVNRSVKSKRPHLWSFGSFVVRAAVFAGVVVLLARIHPILVIACFVPFVITRVIMLGWLGPRPTRRPTDVEKEE